MPRINEIGTIARATLRVWTKPGLPQYRRAVIQACTAALGQGVQVEASIGATNGCPPIR